MRRKLPASAAAFACLLMPSLASAQGVQLDPNSPAGSEYQIPIQDQRKQSRQKKSTPKKTTKKKGSSDDSSSSAGGSSSGGSSGGSSSSDAVPGPFGAGTSSGAESKKSSDPTKKNKSDDTSSAKADKGSATSTTPAKPVTPAPAVATQPASSTSDGGGSSTGLVVAIIVALAILGGGIGLLMRNGVPPAIRKLLPGSD